MTDELMPWSVWYADLSPTRGHEQDGDRLVVVVNSRAGVMVGDRLGLVTVVPLTTKPRGWAWRVTTELGGKRGEAMPEQVRTISRERLRRPFTDDALTAGQVEGIKAGLTRLLDIDFQVQPPPPQVPRQRGR